ncbi:MAG TPA: hypothetical protein VKV18_13930 [Chthonomonas sp.]|jgi:hypothetical protein|uniref:hypothetical protein n=1 Tax=Chthonomonas sp. TaxID=2282153 RepID=UPI002B4AC077|nr:hypothetical protein [Chthonomonas sp.]HLI49770.1 hypothetical protein [Chthonomonas sp.]
MNRELPQVVVIAVLAALGIVLAIIAYHLLEPPKRNVSPMEQVQMFNHAKPLPPTFHY